MMLYDQRNLGRPDANDVSDPRVRYLMGTAMFNPRNQPQRGMQFRPDMGRMPQGQVARPDFQNPAMRPAPTFRPDMDIARMRSQASGRFPMDERAPMPGPVDPRMQAGAFNPRNPRNQYGPLDQVGPQGK